MKDIFYRTITKTILAFAIITIISAQAFAADSSGNVVNVNEASISQLKLLPHVGDAMAQRIIDARQKQPFNKLDDLLKIKGIGKTSIKKLEPYIAFSGKTTLSYKIKGEKRSKKSV